MHNIEDDRIQDLNTLLKDIIDARIDAYIKSNSIERSFDATVTFLNLVATEEEPNINPYEQYASVHLYRDGSLLNEMRNLSGEILSEGDHVRIYIPKNNISNGYIGIKCT